MLLKSGFPIYLIWVADFLFRSADRYVVSVFYDDYDLARYSFTQVLSFACWSGVISAVSPQSQQMVSSFVKKDHEEAWGLYKTLNRKLWLYGVLICLGCFVFYEVSTLYYIKKYSGNELLMSVSLLSSFALIINNVNIYALVAMSKTQYILRVQVAMILFGLMNMFLIVRLGIGVEALAFTSSSILLLYYLILTVRIKRGFNEI